MPDRKASLGIDTTKKIDQSIFTTKIPTKSIKQLPPIEDNANPYRTSQYDDFKNLAKNPDRLTMSTVQINKNYDTVSRASREDRTDMLKQYFGAKHNLEKTDANIRSSVKNIRKNTPL